VIKVLLQVEKENAAKLTQAISMSSNIYMCVYIYILG
jgi:hypothetical protein